MTRRRIVSALVVAALIAIVVAIAIARAQTGLQPVGDPLGKHWTLVFDDEFNGTSVNTNTWSLAGYNNNNVTANPKDCREGSGHLILYLPGNGTGCDMSSVGPTGYALPVGGYVEARIWFPGPGAPPTSTIFNWNGFWTSGPHWPAAGEIDIAESHGHLTVNYHSPKGAINTGSPPGAWGRPDGRGRGRYGNSWHVYGVFRAATQVEVFWDGRLVRTIPTSDNGQPQPIRFDNGVGSGGITRYGPAADVLVDWVRAWLGDWVRAWR